MSAQHCYHLMLIQQTHIYQYIYRTFGYSKSVYNNGLRACQTNIIVSVFLNKRYCSVDCDIRRCCKIVHYNYLCAIDENMALGQSAVCCFIWIECTLVQPATMNPSFYRCLVAVHAVLIFGTICFNKTVQILRDIANWIVFKHLTLRMHLVSI